VLVARWAISGGAIVSLRDLTQSMKLRACPGLSYRWISSGPTFSLSNDFGSASIVSPGVWSLDIKKGESAVLYSGADAPRLEIAPLPMATEEMNRYGVREEKE
jgi:hypothetical protein